MSATTDRKARYKRRMRGILDTAKAGRYDPIDLGVDALEKAYREGLSDMRLKLVEALRNMEACIEVEVQRLVAGEQ